MNAYILHSYFITQILIKGHYSKTISQMKTFEELVEEGVGCAVILAGSESDQPHIDKIAKALGIYKIPFEVRIASAHKQPADLQLILEFYDSLKGPLAYIAVVGGTDALSGTISFHSHRPTITCPPDHYNPSGTSNPSGSSNAYIGRPENAARFVAQMFSHFNPKYREKILETVDQKVKDLEVGDETMRSKYK